MKIFILLCFISLSALCSKQNEIDLTQDASVSDLQSSLSLGASLLSNIYMYSIFEDVKSNRGNYSDKDGHFAAGFIIGNVSSALAQFYLSQNVKNRRLKSFWIGVGLSTIVGIGKEIHDRNNNGTVEFEDAFATSLGGISGSIVISFADLKELFQ